MFSFSSLHSTGSNRYRAALSSDARFEVRILRRACVGPTRTLADAPRRPDRRAGRGLAARRFELCPLRGRAAVCGADAYRYWPTAGSFGGHWECGKKSRSPRSVERYLLLPDTSRKPLTRGPSCSSRTHPTDRRHRPAAPRSGIPVSLRTRDRGPMADASLKIGVHRLSERAYRTIPRTVIQHRRSPTARAPPTECRRGLTHPLCALLFGGLVEHPEREMRLA